MAGRQMVGGASQAMSVTDEIKNFCEEVKEEVLKKVELNGFECYEALQYKSQIVAGTNYFVKVKIDNSGKCLHLRLFEPLPCNKDANSTRNVELAGVLKDKVEADELAHF